MTTKAQRIIDGLSDGGRSALAEAAGTHQGAAVSAPLAAIQELREAGVIGSGGGLTMLGSIVATSMRRALEDEMFGSLS